MGSRVTILNRVIEKASLRRWHISKDLNLARGKETVMQISTEECSR